MKNITHKFILASASALLICSLSAEAKPQSPLLNTNKEAVSFSWAIDDNFVPNPDNIASNTEESVEYWENISGNQLAKGVNVNTTAKGALVRLSSNNTNGIDPLALEIETPKGKRLGQGKAMSLKVSPQAMRNAGSPFPNGTTGFQLEPSLGSGKFKIRNPNAADKNATYTMHVFDKHSDKRLSVTRNKASYKAGDTLILDGDFTSSSNNGRRGLKLSKLNGFVLSPGGTKLPLNIGKGAQGQYQASLDLDMDVEVGGLYEAYIDAESMENGVALKRRVKTAFAIVKPTASMYGQNQGSLENGVAIKLSVAEAGRYEVRGVLYGSNNNDELIPFLASSTAQWIESGKSSLNMSFDQGLVAASGLKAPYELRQVQLLDQSRMGNLGLSSAAISVFE